MFKYPLLLACILCVSLTARAQSQKPLRYKDSVFSDIRVNKNLSYSADSSSKDKKSNLFDLYQPKDDQSAPRPLIIWMHGGGFKFGNKEAKGIEIWSKNFAQRGYVCAAVNYSLSKKDPLFNFNELKRSCYYAVQDIKMAVQYFKEHHVQYNIDTTKIILAGNSAGGLIALQAAYSSNAQLAQMAGITDTSKTQEPNLKVAAVINFWGAIFDLEWLKNTSVPVVSALGDKDGVVPPTHKSAPLYGGIDIHHTADSLGIPNRLKVFEGYSHELQKHFNPIFSSGKDTQKRWLEAGQFAADFLYDTLFK
jgi:acetyl esterase/lipase